MAQPADVWQPPAGAVRNVELEAWEVSERDESGLRHGACTLYRDDGSLLLRCRYERDRRNGDFESYHPNGELESRGRYEEGQLDGPFQRFASGNAGSTPLRGCCVPPGARELRVTYHRGALLGEVFLDGEGRALRSDGTLRPAPAPGVPDEATFEEGSEQWLLRTTSEAGVLLRKSFDLQGRPVEELEIAGGQVSLQRRFASSGVVTREHRFDENGEFHGRCLLRFVEGDGPYSNPAIREVHGAYSHGESIGTWRFFDDEGREIAVQERGEASSDERLGELVARDATNDEPGALLDEAVRLSSRGHVREALLLAARVTSRTGDVRPLRELLDARVVPLERSVAEVQANTFPRLDRPTLRKGLDCLLSGADPAEILRALATLPSAHSPATSPRRPCCSIRKVAARSSLGR
jgi:antitoxin component YwqK of YwqJK toxin-antitoxin module